MVRISERLKTRSVRFPWCINPSNENPHAHMLIPLCIWNCSNGQAEHTLSWTKWWWWREGGREVILETRPWNLEKGLHHLSRNEQTQSRNGDLRTDTHTHGWTDVSSKRWGVWIEKPPPILSKRSSKIFLSFFQHVTIKTCPITPQIDHFVELAISFKISRQINLGASGQK